MPGSNPSFDADRICKTLTIHRTDSDTVTLPLLEGIFPPDSHIDRIAMRPDDYEAILGLPGGREVTVELRGGRTARECRAGRRVVYLDQNQWSALSRWEYDRGGLPQTEARAAERLVGAVATSEVVLAASGGVFVETGPLFGARRVELASTVLTHSRGWQMRNPLHVRVEELRLALAGQDPIAAEVFSPNADELFASASQHGPATDLPPPLAELSREMVGVLALYETLIESEAIPDQGGEDGSAGWAKGFADLSEQLHADAASQALTRQVTQYRLLFDMADDVARAGASLGLEPDKVVERLSASDDLIRQMPFVSRVREVLFARLRNAGQPWEANDLVDIMFLCCAAGYADVLVGERQTIGYLRQARNVPPGSRLGRTLREAIEQIDTLDGSGLSA